MNPRRVEALSDSAFAVALTILIFDVRVPDTGSHPAHGLAHDLWFGRWPHYLGYLISFAVVGMLWLCHHTIFRMVEAIDHAGLVLNLALLASVVFVPFPTQVMAAYIDAGDQSERWAGVFYGLTLMVTTLLLAVLWHHVSRRGLIEPWIQKDATRRLTRRYYVTPVLYAGATGIAAANLDAGLVLFLVIACVYLLDTGTRAAPRHPEHRHRHRTATDDPEAQPTGVEGSSASSSPS